MLEKDHHFYNKLAISFAIIINLVFIGGKLYAYIKTDSLSLFASLMDSSLDLIISIMNLFALLYANKPADDDHRFGHESAADIATLVQSGFIFASGAFVILEGVRRVFDQHLVANPSLAIFVIVISSAGSGIIALIQKYVAKKTESQVVAIDSLHYLADLLVGCSIAISLIFASKMNGAAWIDPCFAMIIGCYMIFVCYRPAKVAVNNLMDHEIDDEKKQVIFHILDNEKNLLKCKSLRTRQSGNRCFIYLELGFLVDTSLADVELITNKLKNQIHSVIHNSELIISSTIL